MEIEIGRWQGIDRENRICKLCSNGIENEVHLLFHCSRLKHIRKQYSILKFDENILCDEDRFEVLCSEIHVLKLSKLIRQLYDERKLILYN